MLKKLVLLPLIFLCLCAFSIVTVKAQKTDSKEGMSYRAKGIVFLGAMELDKAIINFSSAIELDPNSAYSYYSRGLAYRLKLEDLYETRGRGYRGTEILDKAIKDYSKAIELNLNFADAYIALAKLYLEKSDREMAQEVFNNLLKLNVTKGLVYNNRGLLYAGLGEFEKALKDFDTSISLNEYTQLIPRARTYANRAQLYVAMRNYDAAIADYTKQLEVSKSYFSHSLRAWAFYLKGDYERAIEDINLAIKTYPKLALPYATRGTIYLNNQDYDLALADYNKAIELKPLNADYYRSRAFVYRKKEEINLAETDEEKAIELEKPQEESPINY